MLGDCYFHRHYCLLEATATPYSCCHKITIMTFEEYRQLFEEILNGRYQQPPYNKEDYQTYVNLNRSRMKRWTKKASIDADLGALLQAIDEPQTWIIITEPWCGDAANSVPFLEKMAAINPLITPVIQLRDSGSEIDHYLTNGGKSIPKLIVRNAQGQDLAVWGPRPAKVQALVMAQKKDTHRSANDKYAEVLQWYRQNAGVAIQEEFKTLFQPLVSVV